MIRVRALVPTAARLTIVPPTPIGDPPFVTNQADLLQSGAYRHAISVAGQDQVATQTLKAKSVI